MTARPRIGELLINAGLLTREQLEQALEQQRTLGAGGRRLGQLLVDLGFVAEVQLTKVLSQQLSVPWVSLQHIDFSRQLLNLVPRETAEEYCLIPVYVRHERKVGDTLYLAMEDPTHDDAVRSVMAAAGMPVKSMIAAPSDIRAAIRAFYGAERPSMVQLDGADDALAAALPLASRSARPAASVRPAPAAPRTPSVPPREAPTLPERRVVISDAPRAQASTVPERRVSAPPNETVAASAVEPRGDEAGVIIEDDDGDALGAPTIPEGLVSPLAAAASAPTRSMPPAVASSVRPAVAVSARPAERPPSEPPAARKPATRMISLTLLDGTTIQIPAQQRKVSGAALPAEEPASTVPAAHQHQLTTRDLIAALRAVAHGADPGETLGGYRWEAIAAALLSVMLRKQVITDWEFVEELKKM